MKASSRPRSTSTRTTSRRRRASASASSTTGSTPQVLSCFEDDIVNLWGRKWKANTNVGKLRVVLLHRPGPEFLQVGNPTPWPPHEDSLVAWRMSEKMDLDELVENHENLVDAYKAEGVEVVIRKPDPNDPPY